MADITITITADEDDLRELSGGHGVTTFHAECHACRVFRAIAAALPKPRIHPQPGDVLRRKKDGLLTIAVRDRARVWLFAWGATDESGLDPDEWEIVTAAEIAAAFSKKRGV